MAVCWDATGKMDIGLIPIETGGTGGKTAADARTNLQIYSKGESDSRYISQIESAINYRDGSHAYLRYNEGTAGRRAYVGFPSDGSTTFTIANEHPTNPKMHFSAKDGFSFDGTISSNNIKDSTNAIRVANSTNEDRVGLYCNPGRAFISPYINGQWTGEIQFAPGSGTFATREWVKSNIENGVTALRVGSKNYTAWYAVDYDFSSLIPQGAVSLGLHSDGGWRSRFAWAYLQYYSDGQWRNFG